MYHRLKPGHKPDANLLVNTNVTHEWQAEKDLMLTAEFEFLKVIGQVESCEKVETVTATKAAKPKDETPPPIMNDALKMEEEFIKRKTKKK